MENRKEPMKLNCDLGESYGPWEKGLDQQIMPLIDLANIACGFHASEPLTMQTTVRLAVQHKVTIGAHPSYPDLVGFGRRSMQFSNEELSAIILYQIGALQAICQSEATRVSYIKPHGALYNDMMNDLVVFRTICQALSQLDLKVPLLVQALPDTGKYVKIASEFGIKLWFEAFADRAYQDDGLLLPRTNNAAVLSDKREVLERCRQLITQQTLLSITGKPLAIEVDTLCVHGDNPAAVELVTELRMLLDELV